jgi:hypothetical protein
MADVKDKDPMESRRKRNRAMKKKKEGLSRRERREMNTWIGDLNKHYKGKKQPQRSSSGSGSSSGCAVAAVTVGLGLAGTAARLRGWLS